MTEKQIQFKQKLHDLISTLNEESGISIVTITKYKLNKANAKVAEISAGSYNDMHMMLIGLLKKHESPFADAVAYFIRELLLTYKENIDGGENIIKSINKILNDNE